MQKEKVPTEKENKEKFLTLFHNQWGRASELGYDRSKDKSEWGEMLYIFTELTKKIK